MTARCTYASNAFAKFATDLDTLFPAEIVVHIRFGCSTSFAIRLFSHVVAAAIAHPALAQTTPFVAPMRTIADVTAILDQEKADSALLTRNKAAAAAEPPIGAKGRALHEFYLQRGRARSELGRLSEAREDGELAIKAGAGQL